MSTFTPQKRVTGIVEPLRGICAKLAPRLESGKSGVGGSR